MRSIMENTITITFIIIMQILF